MGFLSLQRGPVNHSMGGTAELLSKGAGEKLGVYHPGQETASSSSWPCLGQTAQLPQPAWRAAILPRCLTSKNVPMAGCFEHIAERKDSEEVSGYPSQPPPSPPFWGGMSALLSVRRDSFRESLAVRIYDKPVTTRCRFG